MHPHPHDLAMGAILLNVPFVVETVFCLVVFGEIEGVLREDVETC